jgi:hypothetical protein
MRLRYKDGQVVLVDRKQSAKVTDAFTTMQWH